MNRRKKLLHRFDKNGKCMEKGIDHTPLLPKRVDWKPVTVDYVG